MTEAELERWVCGRKCRFTSRHRAIKAGRKHGHLDVYRCHYCRGWHLATPRPKRTEQRA